MIIHPEYQLLVLAPGTPTPQVYQVNYIFYVLSSKNLDYLVLKIGGRGIAFVQNQQVELILSSS